MRPYFWPSIWFVDDFFGLNRCFEVDKNGHLLISRFLFSNHWLLWEAPKLPWKLENMDNFVMWIVLKHTDFLNYFLANHQQLINNSNTPATNTTDHPCWSVIRSVLRSKQKFSSKAFSSSCLTEFGKNIISLFNSRRTN